MIKGLFTKAKKCGIFFHIQKSQFKWEVLHNG